MTAAHRRSRLALGLLAATAVWSNAGPAAAVVDPAAPAPTSATTAPGQLLPPAPPGSVQQLPPGAVSGAPPATTAVPSTPAAEADPAGTGWSVQDSVVLTGSVALLGVGAAGIALARRRAPVTAGGSPVHRPGLRRPGAAGSTSRGSRSGGPGVEVSRPAPLAERVTVRPRPAGRVARSAPPAPRPVPGSRPPVTRRQPGPTPVGATPAGSSPVGSATVGPSPDEPQPVRALPAEPAASGSLAALPAPVPPRAAATGPAGARGMRPAAPRPASVPARSTAAPGAGGLADRVSPALPARPASPAGESSSVVSPAGRPPVAPAAGRPAAPVAARPPAPEATSGAGVPVHGGPVSGSPVAGGSVSGSPVPGGSVSGSPDSGRPADDRFRPAAPRPATPSAGPTAARPATPGTRGADRPAVAPQRSVPAVRVPSAGVPAGSSGPDRSAARNGTEPGDAATPGNTIDPRAGTAQGNSGSCADVAPDQGHVPADDTRAHDLGSPGGRSPVADVDAGPSGPMPPAPHP